MVIVTVVVEKMKVRILNYQMMTLFPLSNMTVVMIAMMMTMTTPFLLSYTTAVMMVMMMAMIVSVYGPTFLAHLAFLAWPLVVNQTLSPTLNLTVKMRRICVAQVCAQPLLKPFTLNS